MKYTKGNWTVTTHPRARVKHGRYKGKPCGVQQTVIRTDADTIKNHICDVSGFDLKGSGWTSRKEAIANANLIASAPEMLEALKNAEGVVRLASPSMAGKIKELVDKAEGK